MFGNNMIERINARLGKWEKNTKAYRGEEAKQEITPTSHIKLVKSGKLLRGYNSKQVCSAF